MIGAFGLKRLAARHPDGDTPERRMVLAAPIYLLPARRDEYDARCPEHVEAYIREGIAPQPHRALIMETPTRDGRGSSVDVVWFDGPSFFNVTACVWNGKRIGQQPRFSGTIELRGGGDMEFAPGPEVERTDELMEDWRRWACTILDDLATIMHRGVRTTTERAGFFDRQRLRGAGIGPSGWEYRVLTLPDDWQPVKRIDLGGTHASPRWHIRRGHDRHIRTGKVIPVRECEVGDASRGGIVKDYRL